MPRDFNPQAADRSLFNALIDARDKYGPSKLILEDQERRPLSYTDVIRAAFALGRKFSYLTERSERVAVMLPTSVGGVITFFALHAVGRVPVMLNFTSGLRNLKAACKTAGVKRILTSRRFIDQAKLEDLADGLEGLYELIYLEDVRKTVGPLDKAYALAASLAPRQFAAATKPSDPGVILFTSGSFGAPRGVVLSQSNLLANVDMVAAHIDLDPDWVTFNPLPIFHSLGLTGGVILPLITGMKAFEYPSPLHIKQIPPLLKQTGASILFATDTFVNQYARVADPDEMSGLSFIVCGAEKVRDETHNLIASKFGDVPVLEGYGATEASPVIAVNKPSDNRHGTVGGVLPGIETRLEAVPGIARGKRLFVRGANIMSGYLDDNGDVEPPEGGWHDTGDVVEISEDRWITILGRVKRFAKIGGEMVSLIAAEVLAAQVWPEARHAVIAVSDPKKGERLILVTDRYDASTAALLAYAQKTGASELAVPRKIVKIPQVPVLGTGKTDYVAIQKIAETELARAA